MVATFHLHCLGHRVKYWNPEVGNTVQQLLSTTRPRFSYEFIESFIEIFLYIYYIYFYFCIYYIYFYIYNIYIYIYIYIYLYIYIYVCIYIYKVSCFHSFFVILNHNIFSALHAKHFQIWKNILWNWLGNWFIVRSIK